MQTEELYGLTDELLNSEKQVKLRVGGYSMFPALRNGDEIIIDRCSADTLNVGDIIVFKTCDKWIAHRLHEIVRENNKVIFICKGDSCKQKDAPFTEDKYIGKVVSFTRNGRAKDLKKDLHIIKHSKYHTGKSIFLLFFVLKFYGFKKNIRSIYKSLAFISLKSRRLTHANAVVTVFQGILPFAIIYLFKWLIDGIWTMESFSSKNEFIQYISIIIGVTAFAFLLNAILSIVSSELRERLSQSVTVYIHDLLHKKYSSLDMTHLENAETQDKIHRAVQEAGYRPLKMVNEGFSLIQSVISWLVIALILLKIHWIVFILILIAVIPGFWVRYRFSKKLYQLNKSNSTKEREAYYYNRILTSISFAKEIRLFGSGHFFSERFNSLQKNLHKQKNTVLRKRTVADIITQTFAITLIFLSFAFIIRMAVDGKISTGTVVLFFFIFQRGYSVLRDFFQSVAGLYEDNVFLADFFDFLKLPELRRPAYAPVGFAALKKGISVQDISFRYPSSQRYALDSLSMEIPAGKTVAIVGPNGSGKTTLIKLLCGFYTADQGRILFDNTDIASTSPKEIREQIAAVFQDFALYNMTAAENIFLGDLSCPPSLEKIKQAAHEAGIDDLLEKLPAGYNNMIGNLFEKGEELSIGQWQKMAIARAFYRNAPLLFMDEPSSALDAETELQLLQNMRTLSKNKTVLIISHRLSTIKWADIIYVMDEGRISEKGTHEELIEQKGKYFKLFEASRSI